MVPLSTRKKKIAHRAGLQAPVQRPPPAELREPRGARRRRETREKLIEAAFRLMASRGADAVTINEITEAADVGIGSFYNHFESRESLYGAVVQALFDEFADALDRLVADVDDPAEVIAICVRHTIRRAGREPLWGQFLLREGFSARAFGGGLGPRLLRDLQRGLAKNRFATPDPAMSFVAIGAGVLGAIAAGLEAKQNPALAQQVGFSVEDVPERAATVLLHVLGLSFDDAAAVARRPLPEVADRPPRALE
jgi:AcrR family transcriptional regulator